MKARNYPPARCEACGRYTRTLCIACSTPLCEEHATFPLCSDCELESERQALIDKVQRDRERARAEDR